MRFLALWLRRGSGPWLFLPMAGFMVATGLMNHPWHLEFDWGTRYMAASVFIFAPLVAAAAANDVARRARPTLYDISLGAARGVWAAISPAMSVVAWALCGSVVSWVTVGVIVARDGGLGPEDFWIFIETGLAIAAAALLGALIGTYIDGILAVSVAAGLVLMCAVLVGGHHISLFQVASSSGTLVGIERTPARALFALACNGSVALASAALISCRVHAVRLPRAWATGAGIVVVAVAVLSSAWPVPDSEYRPSTQPEACVGHEVIVCGPAQASPLLRRAADDLGAARTRLRESGLALPSRFAIARGIRSATLPQGTSLLDYDTSALPGGHLSSETIAAALSTPRPCAAFFSDTDSEPYLKLADSTRSWLLEELTNGPAAKAPANVQSAYQTLSTCAESL